LNWLRSILSLDKPQPEAPAIALTRKEYDHWIDGCAEDQADAASSGVKSRREKALDQAYDQRKFEIELYWKRATYFWTFIGAAFVGYAAFLNGSSPHLMGALVMSQVGLVFTVAWYLVNRGSKYWQENWENHVALLEDDVTGPIYKMCAERDPDDEASETWDGRWTSPQPRSVSKINTIVSMYVIGIWIALGLAVIVMSVLRSLKMDMGDPTTLLVIHSIVIVGAILSTGFAWYVLLRQSLTHRGDHKSLLTKRSVTAARDPARATPPCP
jgi:hypothetical protein